MSTNDVPGAVKANGDTLAMGCWAEASDDNDKSMILVEANENGRVVYSIFDLDRDLEYRDRMHEKDFKDFFTWNPLKSKAKWVWHDKTPFPWDRVIGAGVKDGLRYSTADKLMSAADKVRESLGLRGRKIDRDKIKDRGGRTSDGEETAKGIMRRIGLALQKAFDVGEDEP